MVGLDGKFVEFDELRKVCFGFEGFILLNVE